MKFTAAQIDHLRDWLARYRDDCKVRPNALLSIEAVLDEMEYCKEVPRAFFEGYEGKSGRQRMALNNRLARFVNGGTPEPLTLEALYKFMSYDATDLAVPEDEITAIHRFMANKSAAAQQAFAEMRDGEYVARRPDEDQWSLKLILTRDLDQMIVRVEEHIEGPDIRRDSHERGSYPTHRGTVVSIRTGYGFFSTERCLLHIFLVGAHALDRVNYIEMQPLLSQGRPCFMRIGGRADEIGAEWSGPPPRTNAYFGILHFQSTHTNKKRKQPPPAVASADGDEEYEKRSPYYDDALVALHLDRELISAVKASSYGQTRDALAQGADPNYQDEEGMTALHWAAACSSRTSLRMLLASGKCDYLIPDNSGLYPSDYATRNRDHAVARLLTRKRLKQAAAQREPSRLTRIKWHNPPRGWTPPP